MGCAMLELVSRLDEALAFAKDGLDLNTTASRFTTYRARLRSLDAICQKDGDAASLAAFIAEIDLNTVALTESQELTTVAALLPSMSPERAKKKFQIVLRGSRASGRGSSSRLRRLGGRPGREGFRSDGAHSWQSQADPGGTWDHSGRQAKTRGWPK